MKSSVCWLSSTYGMMQIHGLVAAQCCVHPIFCKNMLREPQATTDIDTCTFAHDEKLFIMHACKEGHVIKLIKETMQEATNSLPVPWCHVCIWSGGLSHGPPPGSSCKSGAGARTGFSSPGLSCLHCAVIFILNQS